MAIREILLLGNPGLRMKCSPVKRFGTRELRTIITDLRHTLSDFRKQNGFGRGIAAPQIGFAQRVIFLHIDKPFALINPRIMVRRGGKLTLWDECFSFPDLLVKVHRNFAVRVSYQDLHGTKHTLHAEGPLSELLQHEIDHLNGVLAIDRAIDSRHIILRSEYMKWRKEKHHAL